jgi:hypothetical protein
MYPEEMLTNVIGSLWMYTHPDRPDRLLVEWNDYTPYYTDDPFQDIDDIDVIYPHRSISIISSSLKVQDTKKYVYQFNVRYDRRGFTAKDIIDRVLIYEKKYHMKIEEENERIYFRGLKHLGDGLYVVIWDDNDIST